MNQKPAILTEGLQKSYEKVEALRGLDLEVHQGEIFGFLGPNGAGKTTTIRCLLDLIRPQAGKLRVLGLDPQKQSVEIKARVGYLPGELQLEGTLTGERVLRYLNQLRGRKADWDYVRELADRLELNLRTSIKNLSHGNKQKVGIIQAFMHQPELLMLDEPTLGLDPLMQQVVLQLLKEAQANGATVFFSSHIMSEVQAVAERVGIIQLGKIIEVAETSALIKRALNRARIRFQRPVDLSPLSAVPGVSVLSKDDSQSVVIQIEGEMDSVIKALATFPVSEFETERPSLEEVFLAYYKMGGESGGSNAG